MTESDRRVPGAPANVRLSCRMLSVLCPLCPGLPLFALCLLSSRSRSALCPLPVRPLSASVRFRPLPALSRSALCLLSSWSRSVPVCLRPPPPAVLAVPVCLRPLPPSSASVLCLCPPLSASVLSPPAARSVPVCLCSLSVCCPRGPCLPPSAPPAARSVSACLHLPPSSSVLLRPPPSASVCLRPLPAWSRSASVRLCPLFARCRQGAAEGCCGVPDALRIFVFRRKFRIVMLRYGKFFVPLRTRKVRDTDYKQVKLNVQWIH